MKKLFSIITCLVVIICNVFTPCVVYAEDEDYKQFCQGDPRWGSYVYAGSDTLASTGCAVTSFAVLMAYADPDLRDVNKFNPKICSQNYLNFTGNACIYWDPVAGPLKRRTDVSIASAEDVKSALDDGLYIMLWGPVYSGTHFSPIVGWDDNEKKPIVWDVAGGGLTWDDFTASGVQSGNIHVYESSKLPSNEAFNGAGSSYSGEQTDAQLIAYQNVIDEWELHGMPTISEIAVDMVDVVLPDSSNLTLSEKINMGSIKESMDSRHKTAQQILSIVFVTVGLVLLVYTLLLLIGYTFDRTNTFLNVSIVSFLSLGRLKVVGVNENVTPEMAKEGYITQKAMYVRCAILFVVGGLLVSGVIPMLVMKIVYAVI